MNPGQRLLGVFDAALRQPKDGSISHMWARVFEIPADPGNHDHEDDVVVCLQALRSEIAAAKASLLARDVAPEMLEPCFKRFGLVASAGALHSDWQGQRGNFIGPEVRLVLLWCAWVMGDDEDQIDTAALGALRERIEALEASAMAEGVSYFVRELALRQAGLLRTALRIYGVRGIAAVGEALQTATGALVAAKGALAREVAEGTPETKSTIRKMYEVATEVVKTAETVNKGIGAARSMYGHLHDAWTAAQALLPPP